MVLRCDYPDGLDMSSSLHWKGQQMVLDEHMAYFIGQFLSDGWYEDYNGRFYFYSNSSQVLEHIQGPSKASLVMRRLYMAGHISVYDAQGYEYQGIGHQLRVNRKESTTIWHPSLASISLGRPRPSASQSSSSAPRGRSSEPFFLAYMMGMGRSIMSGPVSIMVRSRHNWRMGYSCSCNT